jgi:hypothetical protein
VNKILIPKLPSRVRPMSGKWDVEGLTAIPENDTLTRTLTIVHDDRKMTPKSRRRVLKRDKTPDFEQRIRGDQRGFAGLDHRGFDRALRLEAILGTSTCVSRARSQRPIHMPAANSIAPTANTVPTMNEIMIYVFPGTKCKGRDCRRQATDPRCSGSKGRGSLCPCERVAP